MLLHCVLFVFNFSLQKFKQFNNFCGCFANHVCLAQKAGCLFYINPPRVFHHSHGRMVSYERYDAVGSSKSFFFTSVQGLRESANKCLIENERSLYLPRGGFTDCNKVKCPVDQSSSRNQIYRNATQRSIRSEFSRVARHPLASAQIGGLPYHARCLRCDSGVTFGPFGSFF